MATQPPPLGADRPDPAVFGRTFGPGLGVNLLVTDVEARARFLVDVFGATIEYWEAPFAVMRFGATRWMLHSDWSYRDHPLRGAVEGVAARGAGLELHVFGCDPDAAEARARAADAIVLSGSLDKPHGRRECHIVDADGYVWVPSTPLA